MPFNVVYPLCTHTYSLKCKKNEHVRENMFTICIDCTLYLQNKMDGYTRTSTCYKVIQYYRLNREGNHWKNCQNNRSKTGKIFS